MRKTMKCWSRRSLVLLISCLWQLWLPHTNAMLSLTGGSSLKETQSSYRIPWALSSKSQFTPSFSSIEIASGHERKGMSEALPESATLCYFPCCQSRTVTITMGKGDGKKQRKKKSETVMSASTTTPQQQQPAPLRVSTQINIPVRAQIQIAQLNKQTTTHEGSSFRQKKVERTSYRRTWEEEEIELKREERKRKGQDPDWSVILNRTTAAPLVIVDGYNIIHKWPRLKKHMQKGDPQRARELLLDDLEGVRSIKGWRVEVVFDGHGRSTIGPLGVGPGNKAVVTRSDHVAKADVSKHGVRVVFTGVGVEADSYIEARCAQAKNVTNGEVTGSFIVVTDDMMIRMAGQSAGALCMGADRLVDELKAVKQATSHRVEAAVAKVNGHAVRPEKLRATYFHTFGRRQILIEDKRNRTKIKETKNDEIDIINLRDIKVEEDENGIPWWAIVPNQTMRFA